MIGSITRSGACSDDGCTAGTTTTQSSDGWNNPQDAVKLYRISIYRSGPCVYEAPLDPRLPQESYFPSSPQDQAPVLTMRGGGMEPSAESYWIDLLTATLDHFSGALHFANSKKTKDPLNIQFWYYETILGGFHGLYTSSLPSGSYPHTDMWYLFGFALDKAPELDLTNAVINIRSPNGKWLMMQREAPVSKISVVKGEIVHVSRHRWELKKHD